MHVTVASDNRTDAERSIAIGNFSSEDFLDEHHSFNEI